MSQSTKRQHDETEEKSEYEHTTKKARNTSDSNVTGQNIAKSSDKSVCDSTKTGVTGYDVTNKDTEHIVNGNKKKRNQFGDYEDVTNMSVDDWRYRWDKGQTQFHMGKVHPMLVKYLDTLTSGNDNLRIFLPLCGKTLDLKWLSEQGHSVVGCEAAECGCQQFFDENGIEYETEPIPGVDGLLYKAKNGEQIQIYNCDFFKLTSDIIGQFDCVWDRGSLVALGVAMRERYAEVIAPLLRADGRYLLDCFLVDNDVYGGPPFNCPEKEVQAYFGDRFQVEKLEKRDVFSKWQEEWGVSYFYEEIYLLTLKI